MDHSAHELAIRANGVNDGIKIALNVIERIRSASSMKIEFNLGEVQKEIEKHLIQVEPIPVTMKDWGSLEVKTQPDSDDKKEANVLDSDSLIVRTNKNFRECLKTGFTDEAILCFAMVCHLRDHCKLSLAKCATILNTTIGRFTMAYGRAATFQMSHINQHRERYDKAMEEVRKLFVI